MELSLSLSLYRVFIINIAYLIDCLILIKGNTIIMTDYVSIVRNADIFTKSYKSNISESQKSAFLKYRHMVYRMFFQIIKILSEVRHWISEPSLWCNGKPYDHCIYKIYHSGMDPQEPKWPENVWRIILHVLRWYPGHGLNQFTAEPYGSVCGAHFNIICWYYIHHKM